MSILYIALLFYLILNIKVSNVKEQKSFTLDIIIA